MRRIGSDQSTAKLDDHDVALIKALLIERRYHLDQAKNLTHASIAKKFDVSMSAIGDIEQGRKWCHIAPLEVK